MTAFYAGMERLCLEESKLHIPHRRSPHQDFRRQSEFGVGKVHNILNAYSNIATFRYVNICCHLNFPSASIGALGLKHLPAGLLTGIVLQRQPNLKLRQDRYLCSQSRVHQCAAQVFILHQLYFLNPLGFDHLYLYRTAIILLLLLHNQARNQNQGKH